MNVPFIAGCPAVVVDHSIFRGVEPAVSTGRAGGEIARPFVIWRRAMIDRRSCLLPLVLLLAACSGSSGEPSAPSDIPPPPENGLQIVTGDFELPPGEEIQSCYHATLPNDQDVFVRAFDAFQSAGGHHVILMSPLAPQPDGTVEDCTSGDDMLKYLPLVTSMELNHLELEQGLAIRLPAHAKVVVQSHYINTLSERATVRDVVNLEFVEPGTENQVANAGFWGTGYLNLAVPPSVPSSLAYRCTAEQDMQLLSLIGHMHAQGSRMSIDIGPPGALERVYTLDTWEPSFRDVPPQEQWPMDAPFLVRAGDQIEVTCNWESTAPDVLAFPAEMCASNAFFFPAEGSVTCTGGELISGNAAAAP